MDINDYLIDHTDVDWSSVLSAWRWLLPSELTVWLMNRYGDLFLVFDDDAVYMLDVGAGSLDRIADSRDAFANLLDVEDNANLWLMIPLIDQLVAAGKTLQPDYCYGFLQSPVLGGDYTIENTTVIPIAEHIYLNGTIHEQIRDLPDGAQVKIEFTD